MAKCLRCGAGNEWIEGSARKAPIDEDEQHAKYKAVAEAAKQLLGAAKDAHLELEERECSGELSRTHVPINELVENLEVQIAMTKVALSALSGEEGSP